MTSLAARAICDGLATRPERNTCERWLNGVPGLDTSASALGRDGMRAMRELARQRAGGVPVDATKALIRAHTLDIERETTVSADMMHALNLQVFHHTTLP